MLIRKYFDASSLINTLENGSLYFGAIPNYEDTDPNEGRISETFLEHQKRILLDESISDFFSQLNDDENFKEALEDALPHLEGQAKYTLLKSLLAREHSYIQCWTNKIQCDHQLWTAFGDSSRGASVISTRQKISQVIIDNSGIQNDMQPFYGDVYYNRESLTPGDIDFLNPADFFLSPCFALSGLPENNYKHENEYRFLVLDESSLAEELGDYNERPITANVLTDVYDRRLRRDPPNIHNIFIEYHDYEIFNEAILGRFISLEHRLRLEQLCNQNHIPLRLAEN